MKQSHSKKRLAFRPAVTVAGLCVLGVIILSALHEVSAPGVIAREADTARAEAGSTPPAQHQAAGVKREDRAQPSDKTVKLAEAQTGAATAVSQGQTGQFSDVVLGDPDAPVTVIEYASMTCSHCAAFHADTLPKLKQQYIDTGKVKYIMRAFPLDNLAAAAFMLARCVAADKYYPFVDMLFEKQSQWASADDPLQELRQITKVAGFTEAKFNRCIRNQEALDYIQTVRNEGNQKYDIRATPTLIINGQKLSGNQSISTLQDVIDPLLSETEKS